MHSQYLIMYDFSIATEETDHMKHLKEFKMIICL